MQKVRRKLTQLKKRRERTLNVRLPHVIKNQEEVRKLFVGDFHVKLPRQSSRSCHVIFPTIEEKNKNYKLARDKTVNGKRIVIQLLPDVVFKTKTKEKKKIVIPEIKPDIQVTQTLFISNIPNGTKSHELKSILPGCIRVTLLKSYNKDFRSAIVKMENIQVAVEYLKEKDKWPTLNGHKIYIKSDTRTRHKRTNSVNISKNPNKNVTDKYVGKIKS